MQIRRATFWQPLELISVPVIDDFGKLQFLDKHEFRTSIADCLILAPQLISDSVFGDPQASGDRLIGFANLA